MAQNVQAAILMALLSSLGYPVYNETNKQNNPKPVKIVMECKCRDVTDEEEKGELSMGYYDQSAMDRINKFIQVCNETSYQMTHRKVKDRYASTKFYMNNFKHKKGKKT